ncbi:MAG: AAA family ATPase, partial [Oscillospiraceae bacterium]
MLCAYPAFMPFEQIDRFAAEEQMDKEGDNRIGAGILYIMRHNLNNGHTCVPVKKFLPIVQTFLDVDEDKIEIMLMRLQDSGEIIKVPLEAVEYFYLPEFYRAEIFTANRIAALMKFPIDDSINIEKSIAEMETKTDITYAPLQKKAIAAALQNNAIVLTGGPGTGKTTTVNAIISLLEGYCDKVLLAAPTGRAAKRLSELTGKKATTIHRLLEVDFKTVGDEISFIHNSRNRLKCDAVIIDEMSMVDALLFENLLDALKENCRLILVGDVDQLPSVGAGNVLKGIIDSKVMPVICLKEVFRQAAQSLIVSNAHRIVKGEMPVAGAKTDDFFMIEANALGTQQLVLDLVCDRLPKSYNFSPINDIQVLCPSKIGATGTVKLNELLQERLNPKGSRPEFHWGEQSYREGDKVMQIKNNYDIQYQRDDGECGAGAFNGDIGVIESVNAKASEVKVRFDDRVYVYTTEFIRQLELAYAV